jgi:hypothetical protein
MKFSPSACFAVTVSTAWPLSPPPTTAVASLFAKPKIFIDGEVDQP